jgi:hypothetical protein
MRDSKSLACCLVIVLELERRVLLNYG